MKRPKLKDKMLKPDLKDKKKKCDHDYEVGTFMPNDTCLKCGKPYFK